MQIDETGSDNEPCCVDGPLSTQGFFADILNFSARDAYVSFCIQIRFWIHDSATRDDEVVVGSDVGERQADKQEKKE
jgi:hypothetical protein